MNGGKIGLLAGIYRKLNVHYSAALLARVNRFTSKAFILISDIQSKHRDFFIRGGIHLVTVFLLIRKKKMHLVVSPHAGFVGFTCWFESTPGRVAAVCS